MPLLAASNNLSRTFGFIVSEAKLHATLPQVLEDRLQPLFSVLGRHFPHGHIYLKETYAGPPALSPYRGQCFSFILEESHWDFFFKSFTLMASFIHYLTNTNHTSNKSQPLYFGWGLHLHIKCAKTVCLEGTYNQVKIKNKTLYPTVQRLGVVREQYGYLYLLDTGSSRWHLRQRKRFLLTPEEDFLIYIETLGPLGCLLFSCF